MITLKVSLGTVNYSDFLHVTAAKVSSPAVIAWESWIDVPVANYNFIIPDLEAANYIVSYYDAPTDSSLGTLVMQLIVDGVTGQTLFERKFYTCGGAGDHDPADGDFIITDPYLVDKDVSIFKEGFRYYEPTTEVSFDASLGKITVLNGTTFSTGEKIIVDIKYSGESQAPTAGGLYTGTINVTEATKTLVTADLNKRVRCLGTDATQVITLPSLAVVSDDAGYYIDNSVGGTAIQVKILFDGTDKLLFNGFMTDDNLFAEFWVSKGEHLKIVKCDDNWEVIGDYNTSVGERVSVGFAGHPNLIPEANQLMDGDEYPRLWWWIKNILPSTHYYTDDTVTGSFIPTSTKVGQFAVHSTLKKFRMPDTQGISEQGLLDFLTYGTDPGRTVDYPGGFMGEMVGPHGHSMGYFWDNRRGSNLSNNIGAISFISPNNIGGNTPNKIGATEDNSGTKNVVKNIGVIFARRI